MIPATGSFARDGFLGPVRLLTPPECGAVLKHLQSDQRPAPAVWSKGGAATDWVLSEIGAHSGLLQLLTPILGENIVLWGTQLVRRAPGEIHPWHVDIESSAPDGRFVTAWIGLENTSGASSLRLIAGSHLFGRSVQEMRAKDGCSRLETTTERVLEWARGADPDARLVEPEVSDGEAILFDGRMWHGSDNRGTEGTRSALLMQFAAADCPVRIPDPQVLDWPFRLLDSPRPPAVLVQGRSDGAKNRIVRPPKRPEPAAAAKLSSSIRQLQFPLAESSERGWQPHPLFRGSTAALDWMSCHAAVLSPGHSPHPPHAHQDEELLIVLDGEADLLIAARPEYEGARPVRAKAGDFAYYPAGQHHTIRNPAKSPVTYMMFRWNRRVAAGRADRLATSLVRAPAAPAENSGRKFAVRPVFEGPTRWLRKLHCHTTRLEPGGGYPAHADAYDVAIFVQSGRVQTLGREVGPGGVIYYPAGEVHGMRNIGDEPANYIVFEFHGAPLTTAAKTGEPVQPQLAPAPQ